MSTTKRLTLLGQVQACRACAHGSTRKQVVFAKGQCKARKALLASETGFVCLPALALKSGTTILDNEGLPLIVKDIERSDTGIKATMRYEFESLMVSKPGLIETIVHPSWTVRVTAIPAVSRL